MSHYINDDNEFDPPGLDWTFCNDPNCNNECGRKISKRLQKQAKERGYVAYFVTCPAKEEE